MKFEEAIPYVRAGRKVRRFEDGLEYELKLDESSDWVLTLEDLNADWELAEGPLLNDTEKEILKVLMSLCKEEAKRVTRYGDALFFYNSRVVGTFTIWNVMYFMKMENCKAYEIEELLKN